MAEILGVSAESVKVGNDAGAVKDFPIATVRYANPRVGDKVKIYKDGESSIITLDAEASPAQPVANAQQAAVSGANDRRQVGKVAYILITFFLGGLGIHRFMRGQVGIGIIMLLFGWLTFGIWWLVDFIISLVKLSSYPEDYYVFTPDGRWAK